jgi:hypothetical protein
VAWPSGPTPFGFSGGTPWPTPTSVVLEIAEHHSGNAPHFDGFVTDALTALGDPAEIAFQPVWAFMMPLAKVLAYVNDDPTEATLTEEDHRLIGNLALPLREALASVESLRDRPCSLRDAQMTLDFEGNVQLCCGTFDTRKFTLGTYLTTPLAELQARKYAHDMCRRCMERGAHVYGTYGGPAFDDIAARTVGPEGVRLIGLKAERRRKRLQRGVEWLYRNTAARYLSAEQSARLGRGYERVKQRLPRVLRLP